MARIARSANEGEPDRLAAIAARLREAASRHGTPAYVTDEATLIAAGLELRAAFPDPWMRQYSVKANDVPAIIGAVATSAAAGANVVSRGEWALARRAGLPNEAITLEGIGKSDADLRAAVRAAADGAPLRWVAVESEAEVAILAALARRAGLGRDGRPPRRPVPAQPGRRAGNACRAGRGCGRLEVRDDRGGAGRRARRRAGGRPGPPAARHPPPRRVAARARSTRGATPFGGRSRSFALLRGTRPSSTRSTSAAGSRLVRWASRRRGRPGSPGSCRPCSRRSRPTAARRRLAIEPGRFLVARAGWLVGRVLHVRERGGRQVVLDAGMTELIRPALYGARHAIVALTSLGRPGRRRRSPAGRSSRRDVDGPICESTDALGEHPLPPLRRGDLVAIRDAGAYGASLSSTYNGRPRPPQVLLDADGRLEVVRRRGTVTASGRLRP